MRSEKDETAHETPSMGTTEHGKAKGDNTGMERY